MVTLSRWWISVSVCLAVAACGTGSGDPAVCSEPAPSCAAHQLAAIDVFSSDGCERAIDNHWCGVNAQALAECLQEAAVCVELGSTRDAIHAAIAASVCAAELAEWDDCFANGDGSSGGGDDDDD